MANFGTGMRLADFRHLARRRFAVYNSRMFYHVSLIAISTAVYGLALGWWRSLGMALCVAVKLPIVFVGSTLVVSAFAWMAGLVAGAGLRYREVLALVFAAMASAARLLLGLVPVVLFFILIVVALQTITLMRPMLATERGAGDAGKMLSPDSFRYPVCEVCEIGGLR